MSMPNKVRGWVGMTIIQLFYICVWMCVYIVFRILFYREIWLLILTAILMLAQSKVRKWRYVVKVLKYFDVRKYFDNHAIIQLEEPIKQGAIFGIHPHGEYTLGLLANLDTPGTLFQNLVPLISRFPLHMPFSGLFLRLLYGVESVDAQNLKRLLQAKQNVALIPGGFEETTLACPEENRLYLNNRRGFIKYALKYGCTVYLVFTFGEAQQYHTFQKLLPFRLWLNKFKIFCAFYRGAFISYPIQSIKLITISGKGIKCIKTENPTIELINKYHELYVRSLKQLYSNNHKLLTLILLFYIIFKQ